MAPEQKLGGPNDGADPLAQMAEAAQGARTLFNSYVLAGFNDAQALYIVGVLLNAMVRATLVPGGPGD